MQLRSEVAAFNLVKKAKLANEERLLVFTGMEYNSRDKFYEQAQDHLKNSKET